MLGLSTEEKEGDVICGKRCKGGVMLGSKRSLLRTLRWIDGASGAFRSFFAFKVIIFLSLAHRIFVFCKKFLEPMGSSKCSQSRLIAQTRRTRGSAVQEDCIRGNMPPAAAEGLSAEGQLVCSLCTGRRLA